MKRDATRPTAHSALYELTLARIRSFFREPSAVFWAFGFPIVLSVALGIAFRNRPPEPVHVAVEEGPGADRTLTELAVPQVKARIEDAAAARKSLRSGKVTCSSAPRDARTARPSSTSASRSQAHATSIF
jgi:hypothetical protein